MKETRVAVKMLPTSEACTHPFDPCGGITTWGYNLHIPKGNNAGPNIQRLSCVSHHDSPFEMRLTTRITNGVCLNTKCPLTYMISMFKGFDFSREYKHIAGVHCPGKNAMCSPQVLLRIVAATTAATTVR